MKRNLVYGLGFFLIAMPVFSQLEPCGLYERDGVPGYGMADLYHSVNFWLEEGTQPTYPDFDDNGVVNVLDLVKQVSCVGDLSPGLLGSYYGFQDGTEGQVITFDTLDNRPVDQEPTTIRATEFFEDLSSREFIDSDMRQQFGAVFKGFLYVPESANYTLHIFGNRGMRVTLDGQQILFFDGSPRNDDMTTFLEEGLYPVQIDYYNTTGTGTILFDWSSDGSVIGPSSQTIGPQYLYHQTEVVPQYTQTDVEIYFDPPPGGRSNGIPTSFNVYALGPNSDMQLFENGQEVTMKDGIFSVNKNLSQGLNAYEYRLVDADGRETTRTFHIYRNNANRNPGVAARLYATEVYELVPDPKTLPLFDVQVHTSPEIVENNNRSSVGNRTVTRGTLVEIEGLLQVNVAANYEFRIAGDAGLWVNGQSLAGIWVNYAGEWDNRGEIFLDLGLHHFRAIVYEPWDAPNLNVYWRRDGGPEEEIPANLFSHDPAWITPPTAPLTRATGGRVNDNLVAEYLFNPGAVFEDTSGNNYHLVTDPRAFPRPTGGITYQNGGLLFSEQGGVFAVSQAFKSSGFTMEVDFTYDRPIDDWNSRYLMSLTTPNYGWLAQLRIVNDQLRFRAWDGNGNNEQITIDNVIVPGQRMHVAAVCTANDMQLFIDGVLVGTEPININFALWDTLAVLNVGQRYNRRADVSNYDEQMIGTFYAAAAYGRALSGAAINTNRNANLTINPTVGPLPAPSVDAFPPAGTNQADLDEAHHILNRLSFGPSPDSITDVLNMGVNGWISQQMNPQSIDDSELEAMLAEDYFRRFDHRQEFRAASLFRMMHSKRQLLEVMAQFWENHFNTQMGKTDNVIEENYENEQFRTHAFGNFLDLLKTSAENYPMTVYLDSVSNVVGAPNENYSREILELHCYGVNNGYTQADIVEAARCFTGWTVRRGKFYFNPGYHDYGEKNLLGITIPAGGGYKDAIILMEHLVSSQETADFITWKLSQMLIDDDPPADVLAAASTTFMNTDGDISQVLQTILNHARFRTDLAYRGNKVKTPLEFLTSVARATESFPMTISSVNYLEDMGMELYEKADPTGYDEAGVAWIDTNSLLNRWNLINDIATNRGDGDNIGVNISHFIHRRGLTTASQILDFFEDITTHGTEPAGVRAIAENWMTNGDPGSFVVDDATLNSRIRQTLSLYLRLAEFNKQ